MDQSEKTPKVSVCVITYNHEKYIRQCLQSVVDQHVDFDFEVIVGDDHSTDGTRAILNEIANRYPEIIKVKFQKKNTGGPQNYLDIHSAARGEYVAHLDGDDYWLPGKLAQQLSFLDQHPECVAVYSNALVVDNEGELIGVFNNRIQETFDINYLLAKGNFLNHSSLFYRSSCNSEILGLEGPFLDYKVHLRIARKGCLGYLNKVLVVYRQGSQSSFLLNKLELTRELYWDALTDVPYNKVSHKALRSAVYTLSFQLIYSAIRNAQFGKAWYWISRIYKDTSKVAFRSLLMGIIKLIFHPFAVAIRKVLVPFCKPADLKVLYKR